jgi:glycosyltransferase involved in cell wall biosynthesis
VESALRQPETAEVILVEDNSPDNALEVCQRLEAQNPKVRLFRHRDGRNHGAGESRNLGIRNAKGDYIAFLDADDYYLENRFARAAEILGNDPTIDGVHEAVGAEFENEEAKRRYFSTHADEIATVDKKVVPQELFRYLIVGRAGYIHLNGLVMKKSGLLKVGLLPKLRLHQDMILCIKLAAMLKLVAGETSHPVAIRRLHLDNRITNPRANFAATRFQAYKELWRWTRAVNLPRDKRQLVRDTFWKHGYAAYKGARKYHLALYYYMLTRLFGSYGR